MARAGRRSGLGRAVVNKPRPRSTHPGLLHAQRVEASFDGSWAGAQSGERNARSSSPLPSVLLDGGVSIRAVSEYLGHHDPGFTLRTYAHLMPDTEDRARDTIDAAHAAPAESVRNRMGVLT